jgi:hypothetical protein
LAFQLAVRLVALLAAWWVLKLDEMSVQKMVWRWEKLLARLLGQQLAQLSGPWLGRLLGRLWVMLLDEELVSVLEHD